MGLEVVLFYLFASMALVSAVMVIGAKNAIHSVLFLIFAFFNAAGLLILLGVEFLAMIFLIVYVGAIAVLFLFVVMMLNVKIAEYQENRLHYWPLGGCVGVILLLELGVIMAGDLNPLTTATHSHWTPGQLADGLFVPASLTWAEQVDTVTNVQTLGNVLYTYYFFLVLVSSLVLLVAMIGAIVLTVHKRTLVQRQDVFEQVTRDLAQTIQLKVTR